MQIDCKSQILIRDKSHYIIIKGLVLQEDIEIVNIYIPKYIKQILTNLKG